MAFSYLWFGRLNFYRWIFFFLKIINLGGFYHGILNLPSEYPLKPPNIEFVTPNGRFKPGVIHKIDIYIILGKNLLIIYKLSSRKLECCMGYRENAYSISKVHKFLPCILI